MFVCSCVDQGERSFLTVVNIKGVGGASLRDLDKYLLIALLKCKSDPYNLCPIKFMVILATISKKNTQ